MYPISIEVVVFEHCWQRPLGWDSSSQIWVLVLILLLGCWCQCKIVWIMAYLRLILIKQWSLRWWHVMTTRGETSCLLEVGPGWRNWAPSFDAILLVRSKNTPSDFIKDPGAFLLTIIVVLLLAGQCMGHPREQWYWVWKDVEKSRRQAERQEVEQRLSLRHLCLAACISLKQNEAKWNRCNVQHHICNTLLS